MSNTAKPLVYSCSGCSNVAQMANAIAVKLDRSNVCEMSCIAGVGGDVEPLVGLAKSGRPLIVLDGCPLQCARHCLRRHNLAPSTHFVLTHFGVIKSLHSDYDREQLEKIIEQISAQLKGQKP